MCEEPDLDLQDTFKSAVTPVSARKQGEHGPVLCLDLDKESAPKAEELPG